MTQMIRYPDVSTLATPLRDVVQKALSDATGRCGATSAEAEASLSQGLSVTVRLGDVETIEHNRDKNLSVTVFFGDRSGSASTSDMSEAAIRATVDAACSIASFTAEDPYSGLADKQQLATEFPDLDLWHPWNPSPERAIEIATECEDAARNADAQISNSEGATLSSHEGVGIYGNSLGFLGTRYGTRHSLSCSVIAADAQGMERDYWYTVARARDDLRAAREVGEITARRTLQRLGARKVKSCQVPVLFEAPVASSLLSHLLSAINGNSLYRKSSFLLDRLGDTIFPSHITISEQPFRPRGLGSAAFDSEGVATRERDLVRDGVLAGYVLNSYAARKLDMQTTGNAGGVHNLIISHGENDLAGLLRQMGTGLLVTELIGFGVNNVTGDYSRGAAGYWVENGEIQYPVSEVTIAGNLNDMYRQFVEVGNDIEVRGNIITGSILVERMTVAGD